MVDVESLMKDMITLSRNIMNTKDKSLSGVKFLIFMKDGRTLEYNTRSDQMFKEDK